MAEDFKNILQNALGELRIWIKDQFEEQEKKIDKKMEDRFEKQEVMLSQRLDQIKDELAAEYRENMAAFEENIESTVGGAYRDELELVKDKTSNHEERIEALEQKTGVRL